MSSMLTLHTFHVHHWQRNCGRHTHANDLLARIQRVTQCFQGTRLPPPTDEVNSAWQEVPNHTLPLNLSTGLVFFPASPPRPIRLAFVEEDPQLLETLFHNRSHDASSILPADIESPTPNRVASRAPGDSATSEFDSGSSSSSENTEDTVPSSESSSVATNHSAPSSRGEWSTSVEFDAQVNTWISQYRAHGIGSLVNSLLTSGVESLLSASLTARAAQVVVQRITKVSHREGKVIENTLRFAALEKFKEHWSSNGSCAQTSTDTMSLTLRGISIAGLTGGLFNAGISAPRDIQLCLSLLLEGEKSFDRLCAMHAMLVRSNDKLCKNRNLATLNGFKDQITARNESGKLVWAQAPHSKELLGDILDTIEKWMAVQAVKREQYVRPTSTASKRSVGPRLRNGIETDRKSRTRG